jgi:hypothetical protein
VVTNGIFARGPRTCCRSQAKKGSDNLAEVKFRAGSLSASLPNPCSKALAAVALNAMRLSPAQSAPVRCGSASVANLPELRASGRVRRAVEENVLERFLECGDLHCGFARIRCGGCGHDLLLVFSCR